MNPIKIKIKKLREEAVVPQYKREGDAALDLHSCEDYVLMPGERKLFGTGLAIELPSGWGSLIWDRSGLAANYGITIIAGLIEHTYRGEYGVVMLNTGKEKLEIKKGDRIAQLLIVPVATAEIEETENLSESPRGENSFGSTGMSP